MPKLGHGSKEASSNHDHAVARLRLASLAHGGFPAGEPAPAAGRDGAPYRCIKGMSALTPKHRIKGAQG